MPGCALRWCRFARLDLLGLGNHRLTRISDGGMRVSFPPRMEGEACGDRSAEHG